MTHLGHVWVTLTSKEGKVVKVQARLVGLYRNLRISETVRRMACKKLGAAHDDPNPGITASQTVRVYDIHGFQTFTFWETRNANQ